MARGSICKKEISVEDGAITFNFSNENSEIVQISDFSKETIQRFVLHGISQKLGDAYAGSKSADEAEKHFGEAYEKLKEGNWTAPRIAGDSKTGVARSDLAEALHRVMEQAGETKSLDECLAVIDNLESDQVKALRTETHVKAQLAMVRAERATEKASTSAEGVDFAALLSGDAPGAPEDDEDDEEVAAQA